MNTNETVIEAWNLIYEHFEEEFKQGNLSLGGSIFWKELGLEITRYPGDIDLLIKNDDHYQAEFLQKIKLLFGGIIGYHHYEKIIVNGVAKSPVISYTINLPSGVRVELMPGDMKEISIIKYDHYAAAYINPAKHLLNISILFKIYKDSIGDHMGAGNVDQLARLFKKTRKLYTSVLKYIHVFDISLSELRQYDELVNHMKMAYAILDVSGIPYMKIKFE